MSACPACSSTAVERTLTVAEMMFGTGESFTYAVCAECGTARLMDIPPDLAPYYPEDYYSVDLDPEQVLGRSPVRQVTARLSASLLFGAGALAGGARTVIRRRQFHTLMSILDSVKASGLPHGRSTRILDVGCGSGILVYALSLAGLDSVTGVDPFAPGDRTLDTGARILQRDLADVEGSYDLVMFHHSFEHVPDPGAALDAAARLLTLDGRILIRMPTVSSAAFAAYGPSWVQLDAPRHLSILSRTGVDRLAEAHGLRVVSRHDDSTAFQFWGSEQAKAGIAFNAPTSHFVDPARSIFTRAQIAAWEAESGRLNAAGEGDQAAWVLARV